MTRRASAVAVQDRQKRLKVGAARLRTAAEAARAHAGGPDGLISVVVVADAAMRALNLQYARVLGTTDVLAFDLSDSSNAAGAPCGEVIVNAAEAARQARIRGGKAADELILYVVHGVLHLGGFDDHTAAQRRTMRAAEAAVIAGLPCKNRASGRKAAPARAPQRAKGG